MTSSGNFPTPSMAPNSAPNQVIWLTGGVPQISVGGPAFYWASAILSLMLFVSFFASGAALLRELLPRRFGRLDSSSVHNDVKA
jgi:hypothetical protein